MTDTERFEVVLGELGDLVLALGAVGLGDAAVLIGAQVVALEQRERHQPLFTLSTTHGSQLSRGFSFEPDLVLDTDDERKLDQLGDVLRQQGFVRVFRTGRPATWRKFVGQDPIEIDFFTTSDATPPPGALTPVRGAPRLQSRVVAISEHRSVRVPDTCSYLSMKLEAKLRIRPKQKKDSYDLFAYVRVVGAEAVVSALAQAGPQGDQVRVELRQLFASPTSEGVLDVAEAGLPYATEDERALLAQFVVDTFEAIIKK